MTTTTAVHAITLPQTSKDQAARILAEQAATFSEELSVLTAADWARPTECPRWDVRAMAAHVAGALEDGARLRVMLRHFRASKKKAPAGMSELDAFNEAQVRDRAGADGPAIAAEIAALGPRAATKRRRMPGLVRSRAVGDPELPPGETFGYLFDVIYQRDLWMHRVDVSRATGRTLQPTAGETEIVAQVMRDLSRFWTGPAWVLELTGSTSGTWLMGTGDPVGSVRADTVDYLRLLSGRPGDVAIDGDPAVRERALAARVPF